MNIKSNLILILIITTIFVLFGCDTECGSRERFDSVLGTTQTGKQGTIRYTIRFNANGGTGSMEDMTADSVEIKTLPECSFEKDGYDFRFWATNKDGSGNVFLDKASIKNLTDVYGSTVVLYAQWMVNDANTNDVISYKIIFNANNGTDETLDQDMTCDVAQALIPCSFTVPSGKKFGCWNTEADGTGGISYADGAVVNNLANTDGTIVTLYAQWIDKDAHRIIYQNTKNADNSATPTNYKESSTIVLNSISVVGYTFDGWYDSSSDFSDAHLVTNWAAGDRTSDVTLYAKWNNDEVSYTVKRYFQNISGDDYEQNLAEYADLTKTGLSDAMTDVTADVVTGFTAQNVIQQKISADGSTIIRVYYDRRVIVYTFNADGGKWEDESNVQKAVGLFGAVVSKPANPTRYRYNFIGWDSVVPETFGVISESFTAEWDAWKYTVKFDANDGTETMENQSIFCYVPTALSANTFEKTDSTFVRWCDDKSGVGTSYADGETVTDLTAVGGSVTL
ncbi:MAG: InlB B-repeat-containing protein, partial [Spirochaetales bacterium]|nr:InlB B-repeat-containing protein [Spirochaetales bacterium]